MLSFNFGQCPRYIPPLDCEDWQAMKAAPMLAKVHLAVTESGWSLAWLRPSKVFANHRANCIATCRGRIIAACDRAKDLLRLPSGRVRSEDAVAAKGDEPLHAVGAILEDVGYCVALPSCTKAWELGVPNNCSWLQRLHRSDSDHHDPAVRFVASS
jgi:hypothetical protein